MQRLLAGPILLLASLVLVSASPLTAQNATIAGRVTDAETGQPLGSVQVQVLSGTSQAGNMLTSPAGDYRISVPAGSYAVVAQLLGYADERIDAVGVGAGETETVDIAMRSAALQLNPITVVASGREEKALDAPANVIVVGRERIENEVAITPVDHVKAIPGVDITQTGISQANVVTRGFNNIFSGSLLVITDNRYASVPSLRFNAYNMIPLNSFDPERIEVLLGPASALYGPNAANGVLHIITSSPLDDPGSALAIGGGERSLFQGQFRHASRLSDRWGVKVSGQYFRADDWEVTDPEEANQKRLNPNNPLIAARDFQAERFGGEVRVDFRPAETSELILSAGLNNLASSIELTGVGAGQARDWTYSYGQARFRSGRLFAQAFLNQSDAGDTYLLRTGNAIVDKSRLMVGQIQHGAGVGERLDLIYGLDLQRTEPRTEGTINGANEDDDIINEVGGYLHGTLGLTSTVDLVAALRVDKHSRLEDAVYSPRAALQFHPVPNQNFRLTFNRAFSTPTSLNLFLDLQAAQVGIPPDAPVFSYNVRLTGVPKDGLSFTNQCAGGVQQLCMYSPLSPGQLPATAVPFWNALLAAVPAQLRPLLMNPGSQPGDPSLSSVLRRLDFEVAQSGVGDLFPLDAGPITIDPLRPTITNTFEAGYKGILADRLLVAVDAWWSHLDDFVGPLHVETPSVFFDPQTVQAFVTGRLQAAVQAGLVTPAQVGQIIAGLGSIPVGTVAPDQATSPNLLVTYRNYGELELWGADVSFQLLATDQLSFLGGMSWVNESCFDFNDDGRCSATVDVALNAPETKGSLGARWSDAVLGLTMDGRLRFNGDFPMNSGVYVGDVESYTLLDLNASYKLPWVAGATATITVNNVFDTMHREAVGGAELGRLAVVQLMYRFR
jgi:outer membrane receptor for ferrienterochelin and colicins